jgi:hypothetical protein
VKLKKKKNNEKKLCQPGLSLQPHKKEIKKKKHEDQLPINQMFNDEVGKKKNYFYRKTIVSPY